VAIESVATEGFGGGGESCGIEMREEGFDARSGRGCRLADGVVDADDAVGYVASDEWMFGVWHHAYDELRGDCGTPVKQIAV
jgi:hypothetical protein